MPKTKCDKLTVVQYVENGFFGGPIQKSFSYINGITVSVEQCNKRIIEISSEKGIDCDEIYEVFQVTEKLLMLFEGRFFPIETMEFSLNRNVLTEISKKYLENRLTYYNSKDFCRIDGLKLIQFQDVSDEDVLKKWSDMLTEMDISYQVFLYALSNNGMPVDLNLAFLIEFAEPLTELVKSKTYYCQTLTPGENGTTLRMCIDSLITHFGTDIFENELNGNYDVFLKKAVHSRIRVMHIKKKTNDYFSDKTDCIKYSLKFSLLWRKIFFDLLGIPCDMYDAQLKKSIDITN